MVIGSGNLTSCGHGKNQELWGAFHIQGPDDPKAPLFKAAWKYLLRFKGQLSGISRQKFEWIEKHSGWVASIPDLLPDIWVSLDDATEAQVFFNSNGAFRSREPSKAFFVDVSEQINTPTVIFAGKLIARIGLATNKPAEFIVLSISQDTRSLEAELAAAGA